jgi:hypothetical protein
MASDCRHGCRRWPSCFFSSACRSSSRRHSCRRGRRSRRTSSAGLRQWKGVQPTLARTRPRQVRPIATRSSPPANPLAGAAAPAQRRAGSAARGAGGAGKGHCARSDSGGNVARIRTAHGFAARLHPQPAALCRQSRHALRQRVWVPPLTDQHGTVRSAQGEGPAARLGRRPARGHHPRLRNRRSRDPPRRRHHHERILRCDAAVLSRALPGPAVPRTCHTARLRHCRVRPLFPQPARLPADGAAPWCAVPLRGDGRRHGAPDRRHRSRAGPAPAGRNGKVSQTHLPQRDYPTRPCSLHR